MISVGIVLIIIVLWPCNEVQRNFVDLAKTLIATKFLSRLGLRDYAVFLALPRLNQTDLDRVSVSVL